MVNCENDISGIVDDVQGNLLCQTGISNGIGIPIVTILNRNMTVFKGHIRLRNDVHCIGDCRIRNSRFRSGTLTGNKVQFSSSGVEGHKRTNLNCKRAAASNYRTGECARLDFCFEQPCVYVFCSMEFCSIRLEVISHSFNSPLR
nr:MAG TPA: hypothetical protein [Caudoviricetes sp.]